MTIKWRDPEMQRFFDAKRKYRDHRVAIIWDLQRSVNEEMKRHGLTPSLETILVPPEMGMMLGTILWLKPERVEAVIGGVDLHASLESLRDRWLTFLVEKTATT